jgi:UDP-N-acetylglucosamine--N-acetylmuramyl-(pentapeptide) pyrophosphoryl-undecaprenol N-acetylglucosamine transferase
MRGRDPVALARTGALLALGTTKAWSMLGRMRPAVVVGFGGYPTVPPLWAASLRGIPTVLHEQNGVMGRANRLLAPRVTAIATGFASLTRLDPRLQSKITFTGNPVRREVIAAATTPYAAPEPGGKLRLLVFGGSQGARAFSEIGPAALTRLPHDMKMRLSVVQQCRAEDIEQVREIYRNAEIRCQLGTFFSDLPQRMAEAQLVIARSGAGTVAELMAIGRPAILVPLPGALDDNQNPNAEILARADAGWCVPQRSLTPDSLAQMLGKIFADPLGLAQRAARAHTLAVPNAAGKLADMVEDLARSSDQRRAA